MNILYFIKIQIRHTKDEINKSVSDKYVYSQRCN